MISVENILKKVDSLPPFPAAVSKLLTLLRDPSVTPDDIAETVKLDQALTSSVLRLCNSSYYSLRREIKNLSEAIVYIGLAEVKKIIVNSGTRKYFEKRKPGYEDDRGEIWRHAIATSIIAETIGKKINCPEKDYLYISALLHDIGKLVLSEFVEDQSSKIFALVDEEKISFLDAEKRVLGITHADVGAEVLIYWKFPDVIVSAVRKHHMAFGEEDTMIENIVRLADSLAMLMGFETSVDGLAYKGFTDIGRLYGLNGDDLESIMAVSIEEISRVEAEFGISKEV